eukprot:374301-Amphidinium_carterae.1
MRHCKDEGAFLACKTRKAQTEYKLKWAKTFMEGVQTTTAAHSTTKTEQQGKEGTYMTRAALIAALGGDKDAEVGAQNHIDYCQSHGGQWLLHDAQTKMQKYLYFTGKVQLWESTSLSISHTSTTTTDPTTTDPTTATTPTAALMDMVPPL